MTEEGESEELIGNDTDPENLPDPEGSTTLKGPSEELEANQDNDEGSSSDE